MAALLRCTSKPIYFYYNDRVSAKYIVDMMIAVRGDETRALEFPLGYVLLCPISPLHFPFDGIEVLFETARLNLGVHVSPMPQMGLSSPCTLAGTMVQENAEILAGICITQLIRPGMPICYGGIPHAFDMATSQLIFSGPEEAVFGVAMTQIGKHYGLPVYINVGLADSKRPDAQAGAEIAATLVLGAAAGADIFGHLGISGSDQASSLDMLVLQDEIISYTESALREIEFNDEALALPEIEAVGPEGNYLATDFTATHFRRQIWFPTLFDRHSYPDWQAKGASDTEQQCQLRKEEILRKHVASPVDQDLDGLLSEFVAEVKRSCS
jgi:trimethylamine--corrinoid protein Co-methyltransferase